MQTYIGPFIPARKFPRFRDFRARTAYAGERIAPLFSVTIPCLGAACKRKTPSGRRKNGVRRRFFPGGQVCWSRFIAPPRNPAPEMTIRRTGGTRPMKREGDPRIERISPGFSDLENSDAYSPGFVVSGALTNVMTRCGNGMLSPALSIAGLSWDLTSQ